MLAVAYAANIGGTGVITGTAPNLVVVDTLGNSYSKSGDDIRVTYATWMFFAVPLMFLNLLFAWLWIIYLPNWVDFSSRYEKPASSTPKQEEVHSIGESDSEGHIKVKIAAQGPLIH